MRRLLDVKPYMQGGLRRKKNSTWEVEAWNRTLCTRLTRISLKVGPEMGALAHSDDRKSQAC